MDNEEINSAILGVQHREAQWWRFLRLIAYGIMCSIGAFPKPISVEDWWPLITDQPKVKVDHKAERERMNEVFRKRDEARKKAKKQDQ